MTGKKDKQDLLDREFVLTEGVWEEGVAWRFVISKKKPDPSLCTATFCVVVHQEKLILVRQKNRGWELPGGHLDDGEELEKGTIREVLEETGAAIENPQFFGFKEITPSSSVAHRDKPGEFYPFPNSYVTYFFAEATEVIGINTTEEIVEVAKVGFKKASEILARGHSHDKIIGYLKKSGRIKIQ